MTNYAQVGQGIGRIFRDFAGWLQAQPDVALDRDGEAISLVLMAAVKHFWIMCEIFGERPGGIDEDRYLTAAADLAAALLSNQGDEQ